MTHRHLKPNLNNRTRKPANRPNRAKPSPSNILLKLIITISNHHNSSSAEKIVRQIIADKIINHTVFCNDFSGRLDDQCQPFKVKMFFESQKYKNHIINELIKNCKHDINNGREFTQLLNRPPQIVVIKPNQPLSISKFDRHRIFNFLNSKFSRVKEVYQDSTKETEREIFDKITACIILADHSMSSKAKKNKRAYLNYLLLARAKYEVYQHSQLHRVDITQIGKISEILTRSFCEELKKAYQDYLKEERQQNN